VPLQEKPYNNRTAWLMLLVLIGGFALSQEQLVKYPV
jgi:hypothetical protein